MEWFEEVEKKERERIAAKRKENLEYYANLSHHTTLNLDAFAEAEYICNYDRMEYTAIIRPEDEYLDSCYLDNNKYNYKDGKKCPPVNHPTVSLDVRMVPINGQLVCYPRICIKCIFPAIIYSTINRLLIRIGENRYVATLSDVSTFTQSDSWKTETDIATLILGYDDINILCEIADGKYQSEICMGLKQGEMILTDKDTADVRSFLDICKRAGVFEQPEFKKLPNAFSVITKFNP